MKGFLFKYDADPRDEELKDQLGCSSCGVMRGIRDPDFKSNRFPVWSICGPYIRLKLLVNDVLFFVPKMDATRLAGLRDFICTGILVVERKIPDAKAAMAEDELTREYKKSYKADLGEHLRKDNPRTRAIRPLNFIIGNRTRSIWLGKNQKYLRDILVDLGLHDIAEKLYYRRIPSLNEKQTRKLYDRLLS